MKLNLKNKILSYEQYYKISIGFCIVSSILWAAFGILDLIVMKDNSKLLPNIIVYGLFFITVFMTLNVYMTTSAMRDKEDELYKENVAKTNSSFLEFLFFTAFVIFIAINVAKYFTDTITIPLHEGFIGAAVYALYGVYNGIALHYESSYDDTEEE